MTGPVAATKHVAANMLSKHVLVTCRLQERAQLVEQEASAD